MNRSLLQSVALCSFSAGINLSLALVNASEGSLLLAAFNGFLAGASFCGAVFAYGEAVRA